MGYAMLRGDIGAMMPLEQGLARWMKGQSSEMWYEFARGVQFDAPGATIDLLLAADWISRQPGCDRSTALVLLLRAVQAGLLTSAPPGLDAEVSRAFCLDLHARLARGKWSARWRIGTAKLQLIRAYFGADGQLPLPEAVLHGGSFGAHPGYVFAGTRPYTLVQRQPAQLAA